MRKIQLPPPPADPAGVAAAEILQILLDPERAPALVWLDASEEEIKAQVLSIRDRVELYIRKKGWDKQ